MGSEDADGKRQVVATALLTYVGWTEVDGDIGGRWLETDVAHGRSDTVITLPDGCVGQTRQVELHASGHIYLYGYSAGF
jgi:hypothetical protein